jgi:hypothetical protein
MAGVHAEEVNRPREVRAYGSSSGMGGADASGRGYTEAIHFDGLSAFRPCGSDLVEFFNSTGWA